MTLATNPQEFNAQVNSDIRDQASPDVHEALRQPENLDRWILTLTQLKRTTESQLASHKATVAEARCNITDQGEWFAFMAEQERWRSNAIRFKNGTENKLDEAKYLRDSWLNALIDAINEHHDSMTEDDMDTTTADEKLWAVLG